MKPIWDDAPEWAQFVAQDDDGVWHWWAYEPIRTPYGFWIEDGRDPRKEQCEVHGWEKTLEERPDE